MYSHDYFSMYCFPHKLIITPCKWSFKQIVLKCVLLFFFVDDDEAEGTNPISSPFNFL